MANSADTDDDDVDPRELLRKMLQISTEDAEAVRRDSPATPERTQRKNRGGQHGPTADYGDDDEGNENEKDDPVGPP